MRSDGNVSVMPCQKPLANEKLPPAATAVSGWPMVALTAQAPPEQDPPPSAMVVHLRSKLPPVPACAVERALPATKKAKINFCMSEVFIWLSLFSERDRAIIRPDHHNFVEGYRLIVAAVP